MKWSKVHYLAGATRIKKGFLLFPKTLPKENGVWETRWLENASWVEKKVWDRLNDWVSEAWLDKNE
jgi:hypothetical protein